MYEARRTSQRYIILPRTSISGSRIILCQLASFRSAASREPAVAEKVLAKNLIHAAHLATKCVYLIFAYLAS